MPRRYLDRRAEAEIEAMLAREELSTSKDETKEGEPKTRAHATPGGGRNWQGLVEQRILDGIEQGLFDNLRGMGKPLNLDEDQFVPDDLKLAFRMLRSTGLAPLWVDLNKEIRNDIERLQRFREHVHSRGAGINPIEREHLRKDCIRRVQEINAKIVDYNILAPSSQVHLHTLILSEELAKFDHPEP